MSAAEWWVGWFLFRCSQQSRQGTEREALVWGGTGEGTGGKWVGPCGIHSVLIESKETSITLLT